MIRKDSDVKSGLRTLNLSNDEIEVYLALLKAPSTPLELSRITGIKRTKVYHLLEILEGRSLIARRADEHGVLYLVTETVNLGIQLAEREAKIEREKETFHQLLPMLNALRGSDQGSPFVVRTYTGHEGFKQMLWHELKTKGELLSLGGGDVEELVPDKKWAHNIRRRTVEANYRVREIINSEIDLPTPIEDHDYLRLYVCRGLSARQVPLNNQITIYNDTVAIYSWRHDKKTGMEIISKFFAATMRSVFENLWDLTEPVRPAESNPSGFGVS